MVKVSKTSTLPALGKSPHSESLPDSSLNLSKRNRSHQSHQLISGFPSFLKVLMMGAVGLTSALVLWEAILRLAVESNQGILDHPALGKIDSPGTSLQSDEGFSRIHLNSLGMRSAEPTPKQPGEYRILMLGDSFTRADEVNDGISFSDRLQAHFTQIQAKAVQTSSVGTPSQTAKKVHVINAGKPSASPASYLYAATFHNQTFEPDSTVIQLTESDFTMDMGNVNSEFYLEQAEAKQAESKQAEAKQAETSYQVRHNESFGSAEPLAQLVMEKAPGLRSLMQLSVLRLGGRNLSSALFPSDPAAAEAEPTLTPAAESLLESEDAAMIHWTIRQLNQQFPNVVIVFFPAMNYKDAGEVSSNPRNAAIEKVLTETTAAQGVPFLNMRDDFLAHYRSKGTHLNGFNNTVPGDGHLNAAGHLLVAQRLIDFYSQPNSPLGEN